MMRAAMGWVLVLSMLAFGCDGDGGTVDGGEPMDAGGGADAGPADAGSPDADPPDAGASDAGPSDAGASDAGATDASAPDAGPLDGGAMDAGPEDAGPPDAGLPDAGMCVDRPMGETRPVAARCSDCRPPGTGDFGRGECASDADCTDGVNGRCVGSRIGGVCSYDECFSDDDCDSDELCACDGGSGGGNRCIIAGCRSDADCGGNTCARTYGSCGRYTPPIGYFCHNGPDDDCLSDADCGGGHCQYDMLDGTWACSFIDCVG